MRDDWYMRGYDLHDGQQVRRLLTEFLDPLFEDLDEHDDVELFHFAVNQGVVNVRIRPDSEGIREVVAAMEEQHAVENIAETVEGEWPNRENDYQQVGEAGVPILDKYREYISKVAVKAADEGLSEEHRDGFVQRGSHLLGNNLGLYINLLPNIPARTPADIQINGGLQHTVLDSY